MIYILNNFYNHNITNLKIFKVNVQFCPVTMSLKYASGAYLLKEAL